jgi:hypothetical protein
MIALLQARLPGLGRRHSFRDASRIKVSAIAWRSWVREPVATG